MNDRSIHLSLLDQVANSEHERDEVRRILGEAADEAINRRVAIVYSVHTEPRLCSRCEEGLSACMTPEACRLAEPDTRHQPFARYGLLLSIAIVAGIAWAVFG
jgi:hypothetical protein